MNWLLLFDSPLNFLLNQVLAEQYPQEYTLEAIITRRELTVIAPTQLLSAVILSQNIASHIVVYLDTSSLMNGSETGIVRLSPMLMSFSGMLMKN